MSAGFCWNDPVGVPPERTEALESTLDLSPEIREIRARRGLVDPEAARTFLRPAPTVPHSPARLADREVAA